MRGSPTSPESGNGVTSAANGVEAGPELPPHYGVPERGVMPKPERLNRNALTIAAVVMGVLVLAAVVLVPTPRPDGKSGARAVAPPTQEPTFLDQPTHTGVGIRGSGPIDDRAAAQARAALDSAAVADRVAGQWGNAGFGRTGSRVGAAPNAGGVPSYDAPQGYVVPTTPSPASGIGDLRAAAYQAAVMAAPTVRARGAESQSDIALTADNGVGEGGTLRATAATATTSANPQANRDRYRQFFADVQRPMPYAMRTEVQLAPGPYTVQAGAVIPAVLLTEVNSDLPGDVLAQVSRDVYDSQTQQTLLLPKGAKLLGRYHDQIGAGQNRLLLAWTRVLFPDGRSITLPGLPTTDQAGAGGVADHVDRHAGRMFGTAALPSLIGAGVQLSQPNGGYGPWGSPSPGQAAAGAVGQQLAGVASQLLQRDLDVQPTIRIRQGMPFNVFLTADLTFPGAYSSQR